MAKFQLMPNGCELRDQLGRDWAIQVKPVGSDASEWEFLKGVTDLQVNIETQDTDSTTIDMQGWTGTTKISRALTITAEGKFVHLDGLNVMDKSQELLYKAGISLGGLGTADVRVWRTDIDEGWEVTSTVGFTTGGGANELRTFTATMTSNCAPSPIHSVEEGQAKQDSKVIDMDEFLAILTPASARGTEGAEGGAGETGTPAGDTTDPENP